MSRILLVEDDIGLVDGLEYALKKNGFGLTVARTAAEGRRALFPDALSSDNGRAEYDLLLLDVTLPDGTGFELCGEVRKAGSTLPVIFLTAADEETSIIRGLDMGGDDYITKPFRLGELCSRIRALLRRSAGGQNTGRLAGQTAGPAFWPESQRGPGLAEAGARRDDLLCDGSLCVDLAAARVSLEGKTVDLTGAEYRLLCLFMKNPGRVLTRGQILDILWDGNGSFVDDNTLSVYIRRLREKIEKEPSAPIRLCTVRGLGYRWQDTRKKDTREEDALRRTDGEREDGK